MKRISTVVFTCIFTFALALTLTGCGAGEFSVGGTEDGAVEIFAEKAEAESYALAGSVVVKDDGSGEGIVTAEYDFGEAEELQIRLIQQAEEQSVDMTPEELEQMAGPENTVVDEVLKGSGTTTYIVPAGDYNVMATALTELTGTATISGTAADAGPGEPGAGEAAAAEGGAGEPGEGEAQAGMVNPWSETDNAQAAAEGAGIDGFTIPEGRQISLGALQAETYRYMDGTVDAVIPIGAVEITIRKMRMDQGVSSLDDLQEPAAISGDYNEYKHSWNRDIGGKTVTCYGNRDGEASQTLWIDGGYGYAILAQGLGGDDDYGLPQEDVKALVEGTK